MTTQARLICGRREAVKRAVAHEEVWPVPYHITGDKLLIRKLEERFDFSDFSRFVDTYIIWEKVLPSIPADLQGDRYADIWGVTWAAVGVTRGYVSHHPLQAPNLKGHTFPESCPDEAIDRLRRVRLEHPDRFLLVKVGDLFERAHYLRGMERLMMDMHDHPSFVDTLFERITAYNLSAIGRLADEEIGIDGLSLSDDYGWQRGLLIAPRMWKRFVKPHLKTIFGYIRDRGFHAFLHSDGNITPLLRELVDLGVEVLHPVQPEAMDMLAIKQEYGNVLTLFGGIGTQHTLPRSSPEEIRSQVQAVCRAVGKGGGFILAPGIGLNHDVPVENALAFIQAAMNQHIVGLESP